MKMVPVLLIAVGLVSAVPVPEEESRFLPFFGGSNCLLPLPILPLFCQEATTAAPAATTTAAPAPTTTTTAAPATTTTAAAGDAATTAASAPGSIIPGVPGGIIPGLPFFGRMGEEEASRFFNLFPGSQDCKGLLGFGVLPINCQDATTAAPTGGRMSEEEASRLFNLFPGSNDCQGLLGFGVLPLNCQGSNGASTGGLLSNLPIPGFPTTSIAGRKEEEASRFFNLFPGSQDCKGLLGFGVLPINCQDSAATTAAPAGRMTEEEASRLFNLFPGSNDCNGLLGFGVLPLGCQAAGSDASTAAPGGVIPGLPAIPGLPLFGRNAETDAADWIQQTCQTMMPGGRMEDELSRSLFDFCNYILGADQMMPAGRAEEEATRFLNLFPGSSNCQGLLGLGLLPLGCQDGATMPPN